jgi:hypothetical protein
VLARVLALARGLACVCVTVCLYAASAARVWVCMCEGACVMAGCVYTNANIELTDPNGCVC